MVHRIVVEDQSLRWYGRPPKIADDSIEFVRFQFHLPEDWDPLVLVAQFTQANTYNMLLDGDTCFLPKELKAGLCKLSLFGYAEGKPLRATSIPLVLQIEESGFTENGETPIPPTPDLYAQLLQKISNSLGYAVPLIKEEFWWVWDASLEDYVNTGVPIGASPEQVGRLLEEYLKENPIQAGATEEEAKQIQQNKTDIEQLNHAMSGVKSPFFVPIEWNEEDGIFTTRITYAEIGQAFHAERPIYAKAGKNIVVPLLEFSENGATFAAISGSSFEVLVIQPGNTVALTSTELVSWEALDEKLDADKLPEAINTALSQYQESDPTVPIWAKQSTKPSYSKSEVGLGNVDNVRQYSANNPPPYPVKSVNGKTGAVSLSASDVGAMPSSTTIPSKTSQLTNDSKFATEDFVTSKIAEAELGGEDVDLSGYALKSELPTKVSQLQNDKGYLTAVPDGYAKTADIPTTPADIGAQPAGNYALKSEIPSVPVKSVNGKTGAVSLTASDVGAMPSSTKIPSKTSDLTNDSGFLTGFTESDPTVPSWAKQSSKPSYSKSEVGLGNVDNVKQYSANNPPPYPVTSVNGNTGAVTVNVPTVPTKVSAFTNDAGYLTEHQDISGKLDASKLPEAVNDALDQAKTSGEFDGKDGVGISSIKQTTTSSADGGSNVFTVTLDNGTSANFTVKNGSKGSQGPAYTLTSADKTTIVNSVLMALPTWTGGSY